MDPIITVLYSNWCVTIRYKNLSASCTFSVINGGQVSVNNTEIIRIIEELMGGKRPIQEIGKERWVSDNRKRPSGPEIDSIDTIRTTLSFFLWFPWKWVLYNPYTERLEVVRDGRSNELMNSTEITAKREATVICGRLSFRLASATSSSRPPKINEGGHRIAEDRDDSLMNTSRLREVRLFKPSIFAPSSLLVFSPPLIQPRPSISPDVDDVFSRLSPRGSLHLESSRERKAYHPSRNSRAAFQLFLNARKLIPKSILYLEYFSLW